MPSTEPKRIGLSVLVIWNTAVIHILITEVIFLIVIEYFIVYTEPCGKLISYTVHINYALETNDNVGYPANKAVHIFPFIIKKSCVYNVFSYLFMGTYVSQA